MLSNDQRIPDKIGIMAHIRDIQENGLNNAQSGSNSRHNVPIINQIYLYPNMRVNRPDPSPHEQQQEDSYAGVEALKQWIKTGETNNIETIQGADIVKFFVQAENDQYSRTHPELNLPKDNDDIFNRGTSWWFRSDQKKRANYLYELIEGCINNNHRAYNFCIRDKKTQTNKANSWGWLSIYTITQK